MVKDPVAEVPVLRMVMMAVVSSGFKLGKAELLAHTPPSRPTSAADDSVLPSASRAHMRF